MSVSASVLLKAVARN